MSAATVDRAPQEVGERSLPRHVDVAIVGAGFGGLGAAIELDREGFTDFVVFERSDEIGGTWSANTYPGCQCDVPSNLYSFSFARKSDWTRSYPEQPQILEYLKDCAQRFGVLDRVRLGCELLEASWSESERRWEIETTQGAFSARVLVAAPGLLSEPSIPSLPGLERFVGDTFHSAAWDHEVDLDGARVAVLGTGASAIQFVPRIQPRVGRLLVFQRTPPWVMPLVDRPIGPRLRRLYERLPAVQRAARAGVYWLRESFVLGIALQPRVLKVPELVSRAFLRLQVSDPELRRRLVPDYRIFCKRTLLTNRWYPALTADNVEVVSAHVSEVRARSILDEEGVEREVDVIIFGTGFSPTDPPIAHRLRGRGGQTLSEAWSDGSQAYLGTTVAGFPNLFLLYGPNTNLAHSSIVFMTQAQTRYLLDALRIMRERDVATVEVRDDVQDRYNAEIQDRLSGTVWDTGGCSSWYLDAEGRNRIMWPEFTFSFARRTRRFDAGAYRAQRQRPPAAAA